MKTPLPKFSLTFGPREVTEQKKKSMDGDTLNDNDDQLTANTRKSLL